MKLRARWRMMLVRLHLWLGLTIGALWALQGATGAMLVFHREIDHATLGVGGGPRLSIGSIIAAAHHAGAEEIERIGVRDGRGDVIGVDYKAEQGDRTLLLDAASGRPLGDRAAEPHAPGEGFWRWVYRLHEALLLGKRGEGLIGISGLLLLSASLMGLWIAWPFRNQWRAAFTLSRLRTTAQKLYGWHRAAGLIATLGLVLMTLSGAWMIFAADLRPVLARLVAFEMPAKAPPLAGPPVIQPDQALTIAQIRFPEGRFVRMTMPTDKAGAYVIRLRQSGETRQWSGTTSVTIDAGTGAVLSAYDALKAPIANRLADAAFAIHSGEVAGLFGRLAVMLIGLSLPFFYVTGVLAWWGKRQRRARNRRVAAVGAPGLPR